MFVGGFGSCFATFASCLGFIGLLTHDTGHLFIFRCGIMICVFNNVWLWILDCSCPGCLTQTCEVHCCPLDSLIWVRDIKTWHISLAISAKVRDAFLVCTCWCVCSSCFHSLSNLWCWQHQTLQLYLYLFNVLSMVFVRLLQKLTLQDFPGLTQIYT